MTMELLIENDCLPVESLYGTEFSSEYLPDGYCITMAIPNDIDAILAMRKRTANKLWSDPSTGDQWRRSWPDKDGQTERILESIKAGETYMVWGGKEGVDLVGTFSVGTKGDSRLWTPEERDDDNALYLSRLIATEKGIGDAVVQTVRDWGQNQAKEFVRIDVWDTNEKLINYYAQPERGFQIVRQNPIDGYPSCTLMQTATDRDTTPDATRRAAQHQNRFLLELPERVILGNGYNDLGPSSHEDPDRAWRMVYEQWRAGKMDNSVNFYCPRIDEGWFFDREGHAVGNLRFSSFASSDQYNELLTKIGLRETLLSFGPQFYKLNVSRKSAIRSYSTYEKYRLDGDFPLATLLEGYASEHNSIQLRGGEVSLRDLECQVYRLPAERENGLQPTALLPGDRIQVHISPDKTHADVLKLANGEKSNEAEERLEFGARMLVNEIYAKLMTGETSEIHDLVQYFYSGDDAWLKCEETLLRETLQRHGIYAAEPTMIKLGLVDKMYNGLPAAAIRELLVMQLQDGTIDDLCRCATYFRTFEPYPEEYGLLATAMWEKAEELGCERDVMRTIYAKMVREMSPTRRAGASTAKLIRGIASKSFLSIKDPLPVNKPLDEV